MVKRTTALGPGDRVAVWFQGCQRNCKNCMSPSSKPIDGGTLWETDRLIDEICAVDGVEGITISGGEPFLQIEALHDLLIGIRNKKDLGVIIYTGNTMQQLRDMENSLIDEIIGSLADIIIDGEYVDELNDGRTLRGSSNQQVFFLTERYTDYRELYNSYQRDIQIMIEDENAFLIGVPERETLDVWKQVTRRMKSANDLK